VPSSGYVTRATRRCLPAARSAGNREEASDGSSFVVFIFFGFASLLCFSTLLHFVYSGVEGYKLVELNFFVSLRFLRWQRKLANLENEIRRRKRNCE
jgi:hypothetical protein